MVSWNSDVISFDPKVIDESERIIEGIATAPVYDRVNELITAEAIKKALPDYMKLPVVTVLHKDYAVGVAKDAKIMDDGSLFVRIKLKDTPDVDNIWNLIKSGVLNSFSISGSRTSSTCRLPGSPCVTDGIYLSTITICGNDAANPKANISYINKTLFGDDMTESIETQAVENAVEKTVESTVVDMSPILEAVNELKKTVSEMKEGMSVKVEETTPVENPFEKTIGDLSTSIGSLTEKLTAIESRLSVIEEQKVEKGGILIDDKGEPKAVGNIKVEDYILNRYAH